jgi:hypothetical protein
LTNAAERMRIDSSGNLLVGKTADTQVDAGHVIFGTGAAYSSRNGFTWLHNRLSTDGEILLFQKDSTTVGSIGVEGGDLTIGNADTGLQFVNTSQIIRPQNLTTNSAVDAQVSLGQSAYRFKDAYLSGGVYLGGTGAANKLDDYEEGTWTPVVHGSADGAYTYTGVTSRYTKIGNLVTLTCQLTNITTSGSGHAGYLQIRNAPFNKIGDTFPVGSVELSSVDMSSGTSFATAQFITSGLTNTLYIRQHGDNSAGGDLPVTAINSGTSDITITIQYTA